MPPSSSVTRQQILAVLRRSLSAHEAERARACIEREGNLVAALIDAGFKRSKVLGACAAVTGIAKAPSAWFREPVPFDVTGIDLLRCRALQAAPVRIDDGELCIAYADPLIALDSRTNGLPQHRALLTTPSRVARTLRTLGVSDNAQLAITNMSSSSASQPREASTRSRRKLRRARRSAERHSADGARHPHASDGDHEAHDLESQQTLILAAAPDEDGLLVPLPRDRASPHPAPRHPAHPAGLMVEPPLHASAGRPATPPSNADDARFLGPIDPVLPPAPRRASPPPQSAPDARAVKQGQRDKQSKQSKDTQNVRGARATDGESASSGSPRRLRVLLAVALLGGAALVVDRGLRAREPSTAGAAVVVKNGKVDLESRQRALFKQVSAETRDIQAINVLTNVINIDPESTVARDAFLARAQRFLRAGEVERARRDLIRLQRRPDSGAMRSEVDALLADIVKKHGPGTDVAPGLTPATPATQPQP